VTGAKVPTDRVMDSVNVLGGIVPGLPRATRTAPLFWRSGDYRVVRDGDWKLQISGRRHKMWLYNLSTDPTERINLVDREPVKVAQLKAEIEAQNAHMAKPLWPGLIEAPVRIDVPLNAPWTKDQEYIYWTN
jgi:arylsulfatase A-like enzyme